MVIRLIPDPDQEQIVDSIAGFLGREFPVSRLKPDSNAMRRHEREQWRDLAAQGFFGLGLPDSAGGAGFSVVEEVLACFEFGRFLVTPSVAATLLAAHLASQCGDEDLAASLIAGEIPVALATPRHPLAQSDAIEGELHIFDCEPGDLVLIWTEDAVVLVEYDRLTDIGPVESIDSTVRLVRARLDGVPARLATRPGDCVLRRRANLLIAACQVGMAEAARDLAVEYAKVREQFGKPIGSFQSVAHHCANMEVRARAARMQTCFAAIAMRDERAHAPFQVAAAAMVAADAAFENSTMAIRVHGGMGYTAECDVHNYLKRCHLLSRVNRVPRERAHELLQLPAPELSDALQA